MSLRRLPRDCPEGPEQNETPLVCRGVAPEGQNVNSPGCNPGVEERKKCNPGGVKWISPPKRGNRGNIRAFAQEFANRGLTQPVTCSRWCCPCVSPENRIFLRFRENVNLFPLSKHSIGVASGSPFNALIQGRLRDKNAAVAEARQDQRPRSWAGPGQT